MTGESAPSDQSESSLKGFLHDERDSLPARFLTMLQSADETRAFGPAGQPTESRHALVPGTNRRMLVMPDFLLLTQSAFPGYTRLGSGMAVLNWVKRPPVDSLKERQSRSILRASKHAQDTAGRKEIRSALLPKRRGTGAR